MANEMGVEDQRNCPADAGDHFFEIDDFVKRGDFIAAEKSLREHLRQGAGNAELYARLADALWNLEKYQDAIFYAEKALDIDSGNFQATACRINCLLQLDQVAEAQEYLTPLFHENPCDQSVRLMMGKFYGVQQQWDESISHYRVALDLDRTNEDAWLSLSDALEGAGRSNEAENTIKLALSFLGASAALLNRLGNLAVGQARTEEACAAYRHAAMCDDRFAPAQYNLGSVALMSNAFEVAERFVLRGMELDPRHTNGPVNLAAIFLKQGKTDEGASILEEVLQKKPSIKLARFNLSLTQLLTGNYEDGWENFEARTTVKKIAGPRWDGRPIHGKTLLLHWEQGLGDTLQCCRFFEHVHQLCDRILLWVQEPLVELLQCLNGVEVVGNLPEHFDFQLPLFSLPKILGIRLGNIPQRFPYLKVNDDVVARWQQWFTRFASHSEKQLRCGFVWAGNPTHANDCFRSLSLGSFAPLLSVESIEWICLQKDKNEEDSESLQASACLDPMPDARSFLDTAGIIENLDLVITVDSSVAHLAGALGKPVWVLLSANCDWRWTTLYSNSTPWYPSMKLFRQSELGDWEAPLQAIAEALADRLGHPVVLPTAIGKSKTAFEHELCFELPGPEVPPDLVGRIAQIPFWYHRIKLSEHLVTPGFAPLKAAAYDLPSDMRGLRVLDVGARDGYWTFECLQRGARGVVAIDDFSDRLGMAETELFPEWENFDLCRDVLGYDESCCKRIKMSVYEVDEKSLGRFDVVLMYGVLQQLRYPLLALDRLAAVCDHELRIECPILDDFSVYRGGLRKGYANGDTVLEFYPGDQYLKNPTVRWCPTLQALALMAHSCGFQEVDGWKLVDRPHLVTHCRGFVTASRAMRDENG